MINCLLTLCVDTLVSYCSSFKDVFLHVLYAGLGNTTDMLQMSKAPVVFAHFTLMLKKNATIHFNVPVLFTICCGKTVYVGLSLYTNTVGFKSSNQHVIKKQIFSFNSKTFANILNKLFKNYSNLYTYTFTYFQFMKNICEMH